MTLSMDISEDDLPMLSTVATQAISLLNSHSVTNQQLNDLIRQDPSLASRVLHIANSPFYGGRFQVHKISDAIVRMGMRQLRNILVMAATGELFDTKDPVIQALWEHSMAVAAVSDRLACELDLPNSEEAFIGGLVHDIGKFMVYRQHPAPYAELMLQASGAGRRLIDVEHESFQYFTHCSVGGIVTHKWKLADAVTEAARFHHRFEDDVPVELESKNIVAIVSLSNVLVNLHGVGAQFRTPEEASALACAQFLKMTHDRILRFFDKIAPLCHPNDTPKAMEA